MGEYRDGAYYTWVTEGREITEGGYWYADVELDRGTTMVWADGGDDPGDKEIKGPARIQLVLPPQYMKTVRSTGMNVHVHELCPHDTLCVMRRSIVEQENPGTGDGKGLGDSENSQVRNRSGHPLLRRRRGR